MSNPKKYKQSKIMLKDLSFLLLLLGERLKVDSLIKCIKYSKCLSLKCYKIYPHWLNCSDIHSYNIKYAAAYSYINRAQGQI